MRFSGSVTAANAVILLLKTAMSAPVPSTGTIGSVANAKCSFFEIGGAAKPGPESIGRGNSIVRARKMHI